MNTTRHTSVTNQMEQFAKLSVDAFQPDRNTRLREPLGTFIRQRADSENENERTIIARKILVSLCKQMCEDGMISWATELFYVITLLRIDIPKLTMDYYFDVCVQMQQIAPLENMFFDFTMARNLSAIDIVIKCL